MSSLESILRSEREFFSDILLDQQQLTIEQKKAFRNETVAQRRQRLSYDFFQKSKGRVIRGPFEGLQLDSDPAWGSADLASMLLGCYELEILEALSAAEFLDKRHFVDIGAADGYYCVGTLFNNRFDTADSFELTQTGRETISRVAVKNGVSNRLRIFGAADSNIPTALKDVDWSNTVVLCDIEGAEFDLFDEHCLAAMRGAMIIIEIHNWIEEFWPKYESLLSRASHYYSLRMLERSQLPSTYSPELRGVPDDNRLLMLSEGRPNIMRFLQLIS